MSYQRRNHLDNVKSSGGIIVVVVVVLFVGSSKVAVLTDTFSCFVSIECRLLITLITYNQHK